MKKLLPLFFLICLSACTIYPEYGVRSSGNLNGKVLYEVTCNDPNDCLKDNQPICGGRPNKKLWQSDGKHIVIVQCQ